MTSAQPSSSIGSFLHRNDFLVRRLHSLSGLVPVGAYMTVHLLVNASILNGPAAFQKNVNAIHDLGAILPVVEWTFIFLPIIFHAVVGIWIAASGKSNTAQYSFTGNRRYSMQRLTGYLAFIFIFVHVFHLHGWFHAQWWLSNVAEPLGMAQFRPYSAASTLAAAMTGIVWPIFYAAGIIACCYHLANGIWTAGITWGVWLTPAAQKRATVACSIFGVALTVVGLSALGGVKATNIKEADAVETAIYESRVQTGEIKPNEHKRAGDHHEPKLPVPEIGQVIEAAPISGNN